MRDSDVILRELESALSSWEDCLKSLERLSVATNDHSYDFCKLHRSWLKRAIDNYKGFML